MQAEQQSHTIAGSTSMAFTDVFTTTIQILEKMTHFHWQARSKDRESTWERSGRGKAAPQWHDHRLYIRERGSWKNPLEQKQTYFSAVWIFSPPSPSEPNQQILHLGHGRTGPLQPLVTLIPVSGLQWKSAIDHLCGKDRYEATLQINPSSKNAILRWHVSGPDKNYELTRIYQ